MDKLICTELQRPKENKAFQCSHERAGVMVELMETFDGDSFWGGLEHTNLSERPRP